MKILDLPDQATLHAWFNYEPETGLLRWRRRPTVRSRRRAGDVAGTLHHSGYIQVGFNDVTYLAQRLIWKIQIGVDPIEIDHRNRVRSDNRWANLRDTTRSRNGANRSTPNYHRGVHFIAAQARYGAQIKADGKHRWLGTYDTPEEACAAYRAASDELHGAFAGPRSCECR